MTASPGLLLIAMRRKRELEATPEPPTTDADVRAIKRRVFRGRVNKPSDNTLQLLCARVTELEKIVERMNGLEKWV